MPPCIECQMFPHVRWLRSLSLLYRKKTDMKMLTDCLRWLRRALPIPDRMDHLLWDECFLNVWWRCSANFSLLRFPTGEEGDIKWCWVSGASTVQGQEAVLVTGSILRCQNLNKRISWGFPELNFLSGHAPKETEEYLLLSQNSSFPLYRHVGRNAIVFSY